MATRWLWRQFKWLSCARPCVWSPTLPGLLSTTVGMDLVIPSKSQDGHGGSGALLPRADIHASTYTRATEGIVGLALTSLYVTTKGSSWKGRNSCYPGLLLLHPQPPTCAWKARFLEIDTNDRRHSLEVSTMATITHGFKKERGWSLLHGTEQRWNVPAVCWLTRENSLLETWGKGWWINWGPDGPKPSGTVTYLSAGRLWW